MNTLDLLQTCVIVGVCAYAREDLSCFSNVNVPYQIYWNSFRNELVSAVLTSPDSNHESWERIFSKSMVYSRYKRGWEQSNGSRSSCPLGVYAHQLITKILSPRRHGITSVQASLLQWILSPVPWVLVLSSGWPLFHLLAILASTFDLQTSEALWHEVNKTNALLRDALDRVTVATHAARSTNSNLLQFTLAAAGAKQDVVAAEKRAQTGNGVDVSSWRLLAEIQEVLYLQSLCPNGSQVVFAVPGIHYSERYPIHAFDFRHRVCIRRNQDSSSVDGVLSNYGAWAHCYDFWLVLDSVRRSTGMSLDCAVLDIGANLGVCSALLAAHGMDVVAVEPLLENFAMLKAAADFRELDRARKANIGQVSGRIDVVWAAATASTSSSERFGFHICPTNRGGVALRSLVAGEESNEPSPPVVTLDGIAAGRNVCALKMDIEGSELRALQGAKQLLKKRTVIFLEIMDSALQRQGASAQELVNLLRKVRYDFHEPLFRRGVFRMRHLNTSIENFEAGDTNYVALPSDIVTAAF